MAEIDAVNTSLTADRTELIEKLQKLVNDIDLATFPCSGKSAALLALYEKLKDRIKNAVEFSVPQLVNAMTSFAFAPNKFMGGLQLANFGYQVHTSIPDMDGVPVRKDKIIGKLDRTEVSVKAIKNAVSKDKLDGSFTLDDPYGTKLLATEEEIMLFLEDYADRSFVDVIQDMKEKFDDYCKAIIARNTAVLEYNVVLKLILDKSEQIAENNNKRQNLKGRLIGVHDPDLPEITDYIESLYNASRASVMKQLNFLVRSLNFRMLQENDIFSIAFGTGANTDSVPLTMTSVVLQTARARVQEKFGQAVERWGSEPSKFPVNFDRSRGKVVELDEFRVKTLIEQPYRVRPSSSLVIAQTHGRAGGR